MTAVPALAQPYYQGQYYNQYQNDQNRPYGGISKRLDFLTNRLDQARQNGSINWQEARRLRGVLDQVRSQEQGYLSQGGGHNGWQRNRLNERLNDVAGELHN